MSKVIVDVKWNNKHKTYTRWKLLVYSKCVTCNWIKKHRSGTEQIREWGNKFWLLCQSV